MNVTFYIKKTFRIVNNFSSKNIVSIKGKEKQKGRAQGYVVHK